VKAWWTSLGRAQRIAAAVVALVVLVNVVLAGLGDVVPRSPGGPRSSTYGTAAEGLAGYGDLLERSGHDVTRLRSRVGPADLPVEATAFVADPEQLSQSEGAALAGFVLDGGRLVITGPAAQPLVEAFTGHAAEIESFDAADEIDVWVPTPLTGAARTLAGDRGNRWVAYGPLLPLAGVDGRATVITASVGEGRVVAVADTDPLLNRYLAQADNASFGLALAGPGRPVVFVESAHGYAEGGLGSVPSGWKWAAAGLVVALMLGLWAAGTRFGPPEPSVRALRPPRRDYVDAVAATMQRGVRTPADLVPPPSDDAPAPDDAPPPVATLDDALAVGAAAAADRRRRHTPDLAPDRSDPPGDRP
jgi:hypothetical protein